LKGRVRSHRSSPESFLKGRFPGSLGSPEKEALIQCNEFVKIRLDNMSSAYSRFQCRICGRPIYSTLTIELNGEAPSEEKTVELTCSGGHSDQYNARELVLAETKPPGRLQTRRAMAAGG